VDVSANGSATIFFTIDGAAVVNLNIIPEKQGPNGVPVYTASQTCGSAGAYLFTWDGKNTAGQNVPDEAYLYILETVVDGTRTGLYSPAAPAGTGSISCSQGSNYDPYQNVPLTITSNISQPLRANLEISALWFDEKFRIGNAVPYLPGTYAYAWNGRTSSGQILDGANAPQAQCTVVSLLGENVIITTGDTPKAANIKTDPWQMQLSYGQLTRIKYILSRDATVTITLVSPSGASVTLLNAEPQTAGEHDFKWDGIDGTDSSGKKLALTAEGDHTVVIKAVNPVTGSSSSSLGNVRIWR